MLSNKKHHWFSEREGKKFLQNGTKAKFSAIIIDFLMKNFTLLVIGGIVTFILMKLPGIWIIF